MSTTQPRLFDEPPDAPIASQLLWRASRRAEWSVVTSCTLSHEAVLHIGMGGRHNGQWLVRYCFNQTTEA